MTDEFRLEIREDRIDKLEYVFKKMQGVKIDV